jgi:1-deoxy-D-xylulose-5-phosphate reductoisomerase
MADESSAEKLKKQFPDNKILSGEDGIKELCRLKNCDLVLNAIIGSSGLKYTIESINHKKDLALANKESMVMAGDIVNQLAIENEVKIIPVDSEHSAIFHLIENINKNELEKIYLTASGGPFLNTPITEFKDITPEKALAHPVWKMGGKITVDSATMMNKGLELIEAHYLFHMPYEDMEVIIHPQSIIHSMIKTIDGEMYAQMSLPDMKYPILNALTYPDKVKHGFEQLDLFEQESLTFKKPDMERFPLLKLAYEIGKKGGNLPAALTLADDIVVEKFLNHEIKFTDIYPMINKIVNSVKYIENPKLEDILSLEKELAESQM